VLPAGNRLTILDGNPSLEVMSGRSTTVRHQDSVGVNTLTNRGPSALAADQIGLTLT
jgi:hypothetical protein